MGFLEKRNQRATRRGLIVWTIGGGVHGAVLALVGCLRTDMPALFMVPCMALAGAVAGGAVYWQVPDGSEVA